MGGGRGVVVVVCVWRGEGGSIGSRVYNCILALHVALYAISGR